MQDLGSLRCTSGCAGCKFVACITYVCLVASYGFMQRERVVFSARFPGCRLRDI